MSVESTRTLEQLRQRLHALTTSIATLRYELDTNDPLPSWPSLQNSASLLSLNLSSLQQTLTQAQPLLASAHVYPLPSFPGRTQEGLLQQLIRKKLEPQVEDWIALGERHAATAQEHSQANGALSNGNSAHQSARPSLTATQVADLWDWAGPEGNRVAREMGPDAFGDTFTLEEHEQGIENVVTGLRRKMWDSDDEDEHGEDSEVKDKQDDMDVDVVERVPEEVKRLQRHNIDPSRPPMSLEHLLRFTLTARLPPNAAP